MLHGILTNPPYIAPSVLDSLQVCSILLVRSMDPASTRLCWSAYCCADQAPRGYDMLWKAQNSARSSSCTPCSKSLTC